MRICAFRQACQPNRPAAEKFTTAAIRRCRFIHGSHSTASQEEVADLIARLFHPNCPRPLASSEFDSHFPHDVATSAVWAAASATSETRQRSFPSGGLAAAEASGAKGTAVLTNETRGSEAVCSCCACSENSRKARYNDPAITFIIAPHTSVLISKSRPFRSRKTAVRVLEPRHHLRRRAATRELGERNCRSRTSTDSEKLTLQSGYGRHDSATVCKPWPGREQQCAEAATRAPVRFVLGVS